jgi:hypothetical protein
MNASSAVEPDLIQDNHDCRARKRAQKRVTEVPAIPSMITGF